MRIIKNVICYGILSLFTLFMGIGYASLSDSLHASGSASAAPPPMPDVYIVSVAPPESAGVVINETNGTVLDERGFTTIT